MIRLRKITAVAGLVALGGLIMTLPLTTPSETIDRFSLAMWLLLFPVGVTIVGVFRGKAWGRWLALAAAVAVLPWALILTVLPFGLPMGPQVIALVASCLIGVSLTGRAVFDHYEGRSKKTDWSTKEMLLVRWTIICNLAAIPVLYLFVSAVEYRVGWHLLVPTALLSGIVLGVSLLARGKTIGILLVAATCVGLLPVGSYFAMREVNSVAEVVLLASTFVPGLITGIACFWVFGKPMWRFLRTS